MVEWVMTIERYKLSDETTHPAASLVLLHELDVQATDHLAAEGLDRLDRVGAAELGLRGHQWAHLPRALTAVEGTEVLAAVGVLVVGHVFERRVETHLRTVVAAAGLGDEEVVVDYVP
jgi:hypothetical protein